MHRMSEYWSWKRGQLAEKPKPDSGSQGVRGGREWGTKYCQVSNTAAEYYATAVSETTPYWVTQNLPLCYTKHHAEQDCLPFPPRCYIWLLPIGLSLKWHMAAELRSVFGWHDNFFSLITTRLEHPNGAIILILQILLVVSWVSHHSSIFSRDLFCIDGRNIFAQFLSAVAGFSFVVAGFCNKLSAPNFYLFVPKWPSRQSRNFGANTISYLQVCVCKMETL